tara:strand:+ start:384 stop:1076 length:693 start_codon:yes stop_codon:yes gene_type:complete
MKLLTDPQGNPKTNKSMKKGYYTPVLHMLPANLSGYNVCPKASEGCKMACLNTAGRGGIIKKGESTNVIQEARRKRTLYYFQERESFYNQLTREIKNAENRAKKRGLKLAIRLNGTSDLRHENSQIMQEFKHVQFYDYTAIPNRRNLPSNYHLTFSRKENNSNDVLTAIKNGLNVAVVFEKYLPKMFLGLPVFNGDETDLRFKDPKESIIGLIAKGKAKKDHSGFTVNQV